GQHVRRVFLLAVVIAGLAAGGVALAAVTDGPQLSGTGGPGFTISLRDAAGNAVTTLAPGPVTLDVDDLSAEHNFHLTGPGVDVSTEVDEIGKRSFPLTLADGVYTFVCDPHNTRMHGQ